MYSNNSNTYIYLFFIYVYMYTGCHVAYRPTQPTKSFVKGGNEHGPGGVYDGMADVQLLSHAHVFIGSGGSTFSSIVSSIVKQRWTDHAYAGTTNTASVQMSNHIHEHTHSSLQFPTVSGLVYEGPTASQLVRKERFELAFGDSFWIWGASDLYIHASSSQLEAQRLTTAKFRIHYPFLTTTTTTTSTSIPSIKSSTTSTNTSHTTYTTTVSTWSCDEVALDKMYPTLPFNQWVRRPRVRVYEVIASIGCICVLCMMVCVLVIICIYKRRVYGKR